MPAIQEIRDAAEFGALRDEWNALVRRDGTALPYARHEWITSWWEGFGRSARLHLVLLRDGAEIVAAAPLMRSWRTLAGLPVRALHSLGLNVGVSKPLVARPDEETSARLLDAVLALGSFDVLILRGVAAGTPLASRVPARLAARGLPFEEERHGEIYLETGAGLDAYLRGRTSKFWGNWRNRARRLDAIGTISFERAREPAALGPALEESFAVSLRSWKGKRGSAIGLQKNFRTFFRALVRRFGEVGDCEISLLRLNGEAIAYRIGLLQEKLYLECDIAYAETHRHYSPGTLLAVHSNEALVAEGIREINLGIDFPWKEEWSPLRRERLEWIVYPRRRPYSVLLRAARGARRKYRPGPVPAR